MAEIKKSVIRTIEKTPEKSVIITKTLTTADTWYNILINEGRATKIRHWLLKARGNYDINYAFQPADTAPLHYMTLPSGSILTEDTRPEYISVKCDTANVVVELEYWYDEMV